MPFKLCFSDTLTTDSGRFQGVKAEDEGGVGVPLPRRHSSPETPPERGFNEHAPKATLRSSFHPHSATDNRG